MRVFQSLTTSLILKLLVQSSNVRSQTLSTRPLINVGPKTPTTPHAVSPPRIEGKVCYVHAIGDGSDDSQSLLSAAKECNNGGTVALLDPLYIISKPLDLTFLNAIDFDIRGTIRFSNDTTYWTENSFKYAFQDVYGFWQWGGKDVNWYGGGTIDGNAQAWYDLFAKNSTIQRPVLFTILGLQQGSMSNIKMINPPSWFNFFSDSSDLIIDQIDLRASTQNTNPVKNSDGWDTYRSDHITIQNSIVDNTDDCVSFKPNSTNIIVQNMHCNGSHGMSIGSLGQYLGVKDIVENVYVYNATMSNSAASARIKVFQDVIPESDGSLPLASGGGYGYVQNVTYGEIHNVNDDYAIQVTTCYSQKNTTLCDLYPSRMVIQDILFENFDGTSSARYDPVAGTLVCSSAERCINIAARNISITPPSGKKAQWKCTNVDRSLLDINCVA